MTSLVKPLWLAVLLSCSPPLVAQDFTTPFSEEMLRALLPFPPEAALKFAECDDKTYPTCT